MEQDTVVMQDIYKYVQEGIDETGRARGHFEATGIRPTFMTQARIGRRAAALQRLQAAQRCSWTKTCNCRLVTSDL